MSKNNLKIKFESGDTTIGLKWKGHKYCRHSVCDFLQAFAGMLDMDIEVKLKE